MTTPSTRASCLRQAGRLTRALGAGLLAAALAGACQAAPRVIDASGQAERGGARGAAPLALFELLAVRDQVLLKRDATVTLMFDGDGRQLLLKGPGRWEVHADRLSTLEGSAPEAMPAVAPGLRLQAARTTRMTTGALSMRNPGTELQLHPDASRLLHAPERLSWSSAGTGSRWRLTLATADGVAMHESTVEGGEVAMATLGTALRDGVSYAWQVEALSGPRQGERAFAAFSVASSEERVRWQTLEPVATAPVSAWTLYAAALESAGFVVDARRAWDRVAQARPSLRLARP